MKFFSMNLAAQLFDSHPELSEVLREFEAWGKKNDMPEPTLTELWRTKRQQEGVYFEIWSKALSKYRNGGKLTPAEAALAVKHDQMSEEQLRREAHEKFSWHLCRTAVDIRTHEYTKPELAQVEAWFRMRCPSPRWEVITAPHGTAPHLHAALRDFSYRKKYSQPPAVA